MRPAWATEHDGALTFSDDGQTVSVLRNTDSGIASPSSSVNSILMDDGNGKSGGFSDPFVVAQRVDRLNFEFDRIFGASVTQVSRHFNSVDISNHSISDQTVLTR